MSAKHHIKESELRRISNSVGLDLLGVCDADALSEDCKRLQAWQDSGYAGDMNYMTRDPTLLSTPRRLLENANTVLSFVIPYSTKPSPPSRSGFGKVARYAWGKDYHEILPQRINLLKQNLEDRLPGLQARVFSDAVPFLERAFAAKSKLGFIGKNTLLIKPKYGSFMFIGELITELSVLPEVTLPIQGNSHCGTCTKCLSNCPTDAFVGPFQLDARKCISYLTIEKRGLLTEAERTMLGEWIFGCDVCQEVCPFNHGTLAKGSALDIVDEFEPEQGVGAQIDLLQLLRIRSDEEFRKKFKGTALLRTKREGLLRNACCVVANTKYQAAGEILEDCVASDPSEVIRVTAQWALKEIEHSRS